MVKFKDRLIEGGKLIGIWQTIPSIQLCDTLISSNVDFIIFDMEHSVFDFKSVLEHSLLCKSNGVGAVVRISHYDKHLISIAYDIGVDVIQIPNIKSISEIKNINKELMTDIDELINQKNIDIYFFGLYDISRSYNLLGQLSNEKLISDVKQCMKILKTQNKSIGFIINKPEDVHDYLEYGNYITFSSDVYLIKNNLTNNILKLKSL